MTKRSEQFTPNGSAHTPGPWNVMPSKRSGLLHVETDATAPVAGVAICSLVGKANALLIAAAPELLEALDRIVQLNDKLPMEHPSRLSHGEYAQACAAIKKARGA